MDKYYVTIAYSTDKEFKSYKVTILAENGRQAATNALYKLIEQSYKNNEVLLFPAIEGDEEDEGLIFEPPVLVTQGGFGEIVEEEVVKREYLTFFSALELLDEMGYPEYRQEFLEMFGGESC